MTLPFSRPVRADDLFASPEMELRHAAETDVDDRGVDEGVGTGFDGMSPSAVAERIFTLSGAVRDVLDWYRSALAELGWAEAEPRGDWDVCAFRRGELEHFQVQILPQQEFWEAHYSVSGPVGRVLYQVQGNWPDDADGGGRSGEQASKP